MNKGFIFTLEALFSILILITSIVIIEGNYPLPTTQDTTLISQTYGKMINSIYFNKTISQKDHNNLFCIDFIDININKKTICEGYSE
jgi:uncharacterized protein (UPF0333 family)